MKTTTKNRFRVRERDDSDDSAGWTHRDRAESGLVHVSTRKDYYCT